MTTTGQWILLWNRFFEILKLNSLEVKKSCLQAIRILSRDKTYLNETIKDEQFECLLDHANIGVTNKQSDNVIIAEALKVLCNIVFQSPKCQELCSKNTAVEGILRRLRTYRDNNVDYDIKFFDMNLLFLITALTPNIRLKVKDDCDGLIYLVETLDMLMKGETGKFSSFDVRFINEILKILFNITVTNPMSFESEDDEQQLKRLTMIVHDLLHFETENEDSKEDYHSNIINLLTNIPVICYMDLVPQTDEESSSGCFERRDMRTIDTFVDFLELRLENIFGHESSKDYELIPPVVSVLIKSVRCSSVIRRYVKKRVLPPIMKEELMRKPEEGTTLRNRLCKLLTYPSTQISDLVAELLFLLCKENVGKMIKYTGYGNAAGLFANRGLLGRNVNGINQNDSSDSEDSDTEDYKSLEHSINPVVGCFEHPKINPFEGMSQEQVKNK